MATKNITDKKTEIIAASREEPLRSCCPIPPYVIQHRLGGWPAVAVTIYWQQYKRKTNLEYWVN